MEHLDEGGTESSVAAESSESAMPFEATGPSESTEPSEATKNSDDHNTKVSPFLFFSIYIIKG